MSTKRTILSRPRRPPFSPEVIALFVRCEATRRRDWAFSDEAHQLARMLGLTTEYWTGNTPLDRSRAPSYPETCAAHADWHKCRIVRRRLIAAAAALAEVRGEPPAAA
jgi:hypothetical protein